MAEGSNGRRRFSDKWGKHELDVLAVLSSAFPQWLTSRQIAQRVKAYSDSYGELIDQAAKAAFAKQFQRDRAKLAAMGIEIESRQPEYSSKSDGQDFASYRLRLGDQAPVRLHFDSDDLPILAAATYLANSLGKGLSQSQEEEQEKSKKFVRASERSISERARLSNPGLGLDSIAPEIGAQSIPKALTDAVESHQLTASVESSGEKINVAYEDAADLTFYILTHPGSRIRGPQAALTAFVERLQRAEAFEVADDSSRSKPVPISERVLKPTIPVSYPSKTTRRRSSSSGQSSSDVDRRLRLMLFLSAHKKAQYSLEELADRFIGPFKTKEQRAKGLKTIRKDIGTLSTVSDDGELAGSQFFDIDWDLLEDDGIVKPTNSLGLERLAGLSPQYLRLLTASVSYLAHSPLLPEESHEDAERLYAKLRANTRTADMPWLSLTGYELEPACIPAVKEAIRGRYLIDIDYTDATGKTTRRRVAPAKVFVDEGVYYIATWSVVSASTRRLLASKIRAYTKKGATTDHSHEWSTLRASRISSLKLTDIQLPCAIPPVPIEKLRQWSFDKGTKATFITTQHNAGFIANLPSSSVEPWDDGDKIHLIISSDSWFVAYCISHATHIKAVGPESLQRMIHARAHRELQRLEDSGEIDSASSHEKHEE
jgi:predicted DNA-binding transcriptional regulator YafY